MTARNSPGWTSSETTAQRTHLYLADHTGLDEIADGDDRLLLAHSSVNASMGSRRDAFCAGQKPKNTPVAAGETERHGDGISRDPGRPDITADVCPQRGRSQRDTDTPPIRLNVMASTRNCSSSVSPLARQWQGGDRSRERASVTDTSMMFMMPMPPTISDTPAMPASSVVIVPMAAVRMSAISSRRAAR